MARPRFHALVTAPFALLAYRRWGLPGAISLTAGGVFVDLDHLADYLWVGLSGQRQHFLAPLHAWELVAAGGALLLSLRRRRGAGRDAPPGFAAKGADDARPARSTRPFDQAWWEAVLSGLLTGLALHLVQDVIANRPSHPGVYALLYRLRHGFDRDRIGWEDHQSFHDWSGKPWYTWF